MMEIPMPFQGIRPRLCSLGSSNGNYNLLTRDKKIVYCLSSRSSTSRCIEVLKHFNCFEALPETSQIKGCLTKFITDLSVRAGLKQLSNDVYEAPACRAMQGRVAQVTDGIHLRARRKQNLDIFKIASHNCRMKQRIARHAGLVWIL